MKIVFVSNYINHHQIPFCNAMCQQEEVEFTFIQTEPMEQERINMGWQNELRLPFLKKYYEEEEECRRLIMDCDVALFGGCDDEVYIEDRLKAARPVIRLSERLYKEAQWKAVSPRGLLKKYRDHTRYRKAEVYLLCYGGYVADDFHIVRAYPGKMFRWGYFPECRQYDVEKLMAAKGDGPVRLLWAARFIDWKHPELALETAAHLKRSGIPFTLTMVGGGELEAQIKAMAERLGVNEEVRFAGYCSPERVRSLMEESHIYLATSDRGEGWGAVINEAMNSGCAVVADHMMGAVPYLIVHGENGLIYRDGRKEQLFGLVGRLAADRGFCGQLGRSAYRTIAETWNAKEAARRLMLLMESLGLIPEKGGKASGKGQDARSAASLFADKGPCTPAPVIRERRMYGYLCGTQERNRRDG